MTGPVVYSDDERELIAYLEDVFDGRDEPYVPATVSPAFPSDTLLGSATHVQVQHESAVDAFPATRERPQTRVTCWAAGGHRTAVKDLASLTSGLLEQFPGTAALSRIRPVIGRSGVVTDPDSKNIAVWFLVESNLRGTATES